MSRTNIDIDDTLIEGVMRRYAMRTKKEAVDYALRRLHVEPMTVEETLAMEGTGWDGDFDAMEDTEAHHRAKMWGWDIDAPNSHPPA